MLAYVQYLNYIVCNLTIFTLDDVVLGITKNRKSKGPQEPYESVHYVNDPVFEVQNLLCHLGFVIFGIHMYIKLGSKLKYFSFV